jgi:hypothetical protein
MRARLDAVDIGENEGEDVADVLAQRAEIDELQREVDKATELVRQLQSDASFGLRDMASDVQGLADEGWCMSAYMQLEALKEQILSGAGNPADLMAALASLELQEAEHEAAADAACQQATDDAPLTKADMDAELEMLRAVKSKLENDLDAARLALA